MIAVSSSYVPVKRKTKNSLQWKAFIESKLKESRGFNKHESIKQ